MAHQQPAGWTPPLALTSSTRSQGVFATKNGLQQRLYTLHSWRLHTLQAHRPILRSLLEDFQVSIQGAEEGEIEEAPGEQQQAKGKGQAAGQGMFVCVCVNELCACRARCVCVCVCVNELCACVCGLCKGCKGIKVGSGATGQFSRTGSW